MTRKRPRLPDDPEWLARYMSAEVALVFERVVAVCGPETAIKLFKQQIEYTRERLHPPKPNPLDKPFLTMGYPARREVRTSDRLQICIWFLKLPAPQNASEEATYGAIRKQYFKLGGGTQVIVDKIARLRPPPPRKRRGALKYGEAEKTEVLAAWAAAKQRGVTQQRFAKTTGRSVRQLRYFLTRK